MYTNKTALTLGFHGCDKGIMERVIKQGIALNQSNNDYDWLGNGIYFWENDNERALKYAKLIKHNPKRSKSKISNPSVIGAVLDLGCCLDLLNNFFLELLKIGYNLVKETNEKSGYEMPQNIPIGNEKDLLLRKLDCAVIEATCALYFKNTGRSIDSVRGVFWEGKDLYPNAGFKEKNHIQICVRNPNCIKGYFLPRDKDSQYPDP